MRQRSEIAYLWWSLPVTTAAMVVSDPVPAVVGTAMSGGMRRRTFKSPTSCESGLSRPREARRGGLGCVHRRAAADDEKAVAAINLVLRGDLFDRLDRRIRLDRGEDGEQDVLLVKFFLQGAEVLVRALAAACR